jgi:head-tail adaptor
MATLPTAGELNKRVTIKQWSDAPNAAFSLDQSFTDPIDRWAKVEPVGALAHYAAKQVSDTLTHRITVRQDSQTKPELFTTAVVIEHKQRRYRVLRATDLLGAGRFTQVECTDLGAIEA